MIDVTDHKQVLNAIPHQPPFRFVDEISSLDSNTVEGYYFFKKDEYFYSGHFPNLPITPSVILTEAMAQIGLLPLGIVNYLSENPSLNLDEFNPIFTNSELKFVKPVFPETRVKVKAEKVYFRMNRIKAKVQLFNEADELCASGMLSGIMATNKELTF